jgi:hypothetical protein
MQAIGVPDILVVVSPHLGLLDSWLPILSEIRRRDLLAHISAILPTENVRSQFREGNLLTELGEAIFDSVLCASGDEEWVAFDSLRAAAGLSTDKTSEPKMIDLAEIGAGVGGSFRHRGGKEEAHAADHGGVRQRNLVLAPA